MTIPDTTPPPCNVCDKDDTAGSGGAGIKSTSGLIALGRDREDRRDEEVGRVCGAVPATEMMPVGREAGEICDRDRELRVYGMGTNLMSLVSGC